MKPEIKREEVAELLDYDTESGVFRWKASRGRVKAGDVAGRVNNGFGYRQITIRRYGYVAHRLAFLLMTGAMPSGDVDHINGQRDDNRFSNLRVVSRAVNMQNLRKPHKNNQIGLLGVSPTKDGRFISQIVVNGHKRNLGTFDCPHVAHAVYLAQKRLWHPGNTL